ncbi:MAG: ABC transporter permease [Verrucomicrobiales bacterium]
MTRTLIKKELRQHWAWFLLLAAIYFALLFLQIAAMAQASDASSVFDPFGRFGVGVGMVIAAAMICSRLVAAEYRSSTQLFLEAPPLSRLRFVLVEYLFGLGVLAIFLTAGFALACLFGLRHEILTPKFAGIMLARAGAYTLFWFGYFFATSMLGRYRYDLGLVADLPYVF